MAATASVCKGASQHFLLCSLSSASCGPAECCQPPCSTLCSRHLAGSPGAIHELRPAGEPAACLQAADSAAWAAPAGFTPAHAGLMLLYACGCVHAALVSWLLVKARDCPTQESPGQERAMMTHPCCTGALWCGSRLGGCILLRLHAARVSSPTGCTYECRSCIGVPYSAGIRQAVVSCRPALRLGRLGSGTVSCLVAGEVQWHMSVCELLLA